MFYSSLIFYYILSTVEGKGVKGYMRIKDRVAEKRASRTIDE